MRKSIAAGVFLILSVSAFADIIPTGYHYVYREIRITNSEKYLNIVLVGYEHSVAGEHRAYMIESSTVLSIGYKRNTLYVLVFERDAVPKFLSPFGGEVIN